MSALEYVDSAIRALADDSHREMFTRWSQEYRQRHYGTLERSNAPKKHTGYPGFEANLHALLFNELKSKDPHSEWPYASYINRSTERVDIHLFIDTVEVWIELGMYASDEKAKYYKDFLKLVAMIDESPISIGVLIHFEVYPRGVVRSIFEDIQSRYGERYDIDLLALQNAEQPLAHRLSIKVKGR